MIGLVGIAIVFIMVFGGYLLAGGKMGIILKSLPFEMIMIGGAALGAFVIGNDIGGIKHTLKDIGKVFKGPKWKSQDYTDVMCLLFELIRIARSNPLLLEQHIEAPDDSSIFAKYPKIQKDKEAVALICDDEPDQQSAFAAIRTMFPGREIKVLVVHPLGRPETHFVGD